MADNTDYFDIMDAVVKRIIKSVYKTVPSKSSKALPKWKLYSGENLSEAVGMATRLFEVKESEEAPELVFTGSGTDDYDVKVEIEICYPDNNKLNSVARGDYNKIRNELLGSTNIELIDLGFGCFTFLESELEEPDEENEYRIMTIPITCRISVGKTSTIEEWNIGANGIDVRFV